MKILKLCNFNDNLEYFQMKRKNTGYLAGFLYSKKSKDGGRVSQDFLPSIVLLNHPSKSLLAGQGHC